MRVLNTVHAPVPSELSSKVYICGRIWTWCCLWQPNLSLWPSLRSHVGGAWICQSSTNCFQLVKKKRETNCNTLLIAQKTTRCGCEVEAVYRNLNSLFFFFEQPCSTSMVLAVAPRTHVVHTFVCEKDCQWSFQLQWAFDDSYTIVNPLWLVPVMWWTQTSPQDKVKMFFFFLQKCQSSFVAKALSLICFQKPSHHWTLKPVNVHLYLNHQSVRVWVSL